MQSKWYNPHLGKDGQPEEQPVMNKCIWIQGSECLRQLAASHGTRGESVLQASVLQMLSDHMLQYGFVSFNKHILKLEMLILSILIILISLFNIVVLEFDQCTITKGEVVHLHWDSSMIWRKQGWQTRVMPLFQCLLDVAAHTNDEELQCLH